MQVWVVMGNDYPNAVFSTAEKARAFCKERTEANEQEMEKGYHTKIYYRYYVFGLDASVKQ